MKHVQRISLIFFGFISAFILLEASLRFANLIFSQADKLRNNYSLKQKGGCRILCIGESTTGLGGKDSYPSQLEAILNNVNMGIKFSVINAGSSSNTSTILYDLKESLDRYKPDIVVSMMGINDCAAHMPYEDTVGKENTTFLRSLRLYKLTKIICLNLTSKLKQATFNHDKKNSSAKPSSWPLNEAVEQQPPDVSLEAVLTITESPDMKDCAFYDQLGDAYLDRRDFINAEYYYKKAIKFCLKDPHAYLGLGQVYMHLAKYDLSELYYKKSIELEPRSEFAYFMLGWCFNLQKKYASAEKALNQSLAMDPQYYNAWAELWRTYNYTKRYELAEKSIKNFIKSTSKKGLGYNNLIQAYMFKGDYKKAREVIDQCVSDITENNYRIFKNILDSRNIKLVCVQYPTKSVVPLKMIFDGQSDGITFVDNEGSFKKAVEKEGNKGYFWDMFGVTFGHCTKKGNRLLAQNIFEALLKDVFNNKKGL